MDVPGSIVVARRLELTVLRREARWPIDSCLLFSHEQSRAHATGTINSDLDNLDRHLNRALCCWLLSPLLCSSSSQSTADFVGFEYKHLLARITINTVVGEGCGGPETKPRMFHGSL